MSREEQLEAGRPWIAVGRINAALEILTGMDVAGLSREERDLLSRCRATGYELRDCLEGRLGDGQ